MFQFRRFPSHTYLFQYGIPCGGFPHSEISGSLLICSSPKLIAAYHVLHRLLMPRHSPCALSSLTVLKLCSFFPVNLIDSPIGSLNSWIMQAHVLEVFTLKLYFTLKIFPLLLPSHNCIIITMFSFQGTCELLEAQWNFSSTWNFSQLPTSSLFTITSYFKKLVGQNGLEPSTSRLSVVCSSQLSYWPILTSSKSGTFVNCQLSAVNCQLFLCPLNWITQSFQNTLYWP